VSNDPYSASYYYITDSSGHTYIEYWYFYRYNSFSDTLLVGGSHHEGDWESVAVAPSPDHSHFEYVSFSQHGKWYSYLRGNLQCSDQEDQTCGSESNPRGKRVYDYVSNGDHANYPYSCSELIPSPPYECQRGEGGTIGERGHDGASYWAHDFDGQGLLPMPAIGSGNWSDWAGHWGATGPEPSAPWIEPGQASPQSPGSQSMFQQPWGECGKDVSENNCALPSRESLGKASAAGTLVRLSGDCRTWFGAEVAALACNRGRLRETVRARRLDQAGKMRIVIRRNRRRGLHLPAIAGAGSAEGITQAVGAPLRSGDRLALRGEIEPGTVLALRLFHQGRIVTRYLRPPATRRSHELITVERSAALNVRPAPKAG
jgi:hypothetical protein